MAGLGPAIELTDTLGNTFHILIVELCTLYVYVCVYMAVPGRIEFIPLHFLTALSHSKRCSTELRLRVGLISAT